MGYFFCVNKKNNNLQKKEKVQTLALKVYNVPPALSSSFRSPSLLSYLLFAYCHFYSNVWTLLYCDVEKLLFGGNCFISYIAIIAITHCVGIFVSSKALPKNYLRTGNYFLLYPMFWGYSSHLSSNLMRRMCEQVQG